MKNIPKPQVVFFMPGLYPCQTGGMEIFNYHLAKNLANKNLACEFVVLTSCKQYVKENTHAHYLNSRYFGLRRYGLGALSSFFSLLFCKHIHWKNVKLIFVPYTSNFSNYSLIFPLLKKVFKTAYMLHIHGGGMRKWKPYFAHRLLFKHAFKIAGVSPSIVAEYSQRANRKVDLLMPLMPFKHTETDKSILKKKHGLEKFNKIILFVGSLKKIKAPGVMLEAFLEIGMETIEKSNVGLVFCGDGPLKNELGQKSAQSDRRERIVFKGNIPNESIHEFYALADVFVIPSWFEGTPIALLQAMQNGLLCIGSDVQGINSIIKHEHIGLLFPKDDSIALKKLIENIFAVRYNVPEIKKNAKNFYLERFDYLKFVKDFLIYINILNLNI